MYETDKDKQCAGYDFEYKTRKIKVDIKKEITIEKTVFLDELNKLLHEYLTYGSYPRIVLEKNQDKKKPPLLEVADTDFPCTKNQCNSILSCQSCFLGINSSGYPTKYY